MFESKDLEVFLEDRCNGALQSSTYDHVNTLIIAFVGSLFDKTDKTWPNVIKCSKTIALKTL